MFFFEKKNQKTFANMGRSLNQAPELDSALKWKKFFGSFFSRKNYLLALLEDSISKQSRIRLQCAQTGAASGLREVPGNSATLISPSRLRAWAMSKLFCMRISVSIETPKAFSIRSAISRGQMRPLIHQHRKRRARHPQRPRRIGHRKAKALDNLAL